MSLKHKQIRISSLLALFLVSLLFPLLTIVPRANATDATKLCIPPHNDKTKEPSGWFTATFRNRAVIDITYTPNGNCKSPTGQSSEYIFANTKFASLLNGQYIDTNTGDGNFEYIHRNSGNSQSDESRLNNFDDSLDGGIKDKFNGQDKYVSDDYIRSKIADVEYLIGLEEDSVKADCEGFTNGNWILSDKPNDGKPMEWTCGSSFPSNANGFKVGTRISGLSNFNITYRVVGTGKDAYIQHVSKGEQNSRTFKWCAGQSKYLNNDCEGDLYIDVDQASLDSIGTGTRKLSLKKLGSADKEDVLVAGNTNADGQQTGSTPSDSTSPNNTDSNSCESKGGALGWIMCPIINSLDGFFNWVDSRIQELLNVESSKYRDENLKNAWVNIRNISYLILIPVMLVMVIGTAMGFEFFSAYTVKRAMPRLIAAILFITLSWEITGFLIQLSNDVGNGILGLITSPLNAGGADGLTLQDLFSTSYGGAALQGLIVSGGIGAAIIASGAGIGLLGIAFSFLGTASLILLGAFIVLIARQLFILALMIFAPVAIIAWIFPGNDRLWKLWWGTFTKLLLMYPLITALIGSGRVFAYIIGHADSSGVEGGILNPIMKLCAYVIPYALIPLTFKFAGGAVANIAGMVNNRNKGLFDRLKKGRQVRYERDGRKILQKRADLQNQWQGKAGVGAKGKLYGFASRRIGGYNVQAADSARRASVSKELNDQIATGRDEEIRGLSVNKKDALSTGGAKWLGKDQYGKDIWDKDINNRSILWRTNENGGREFKTLGGAWVSEGAVDEGYRKWGKDTYAQQASLSYEMRKASTNDEVTGIAERYETLATDKNGGWGQTTNQARGTLIGAGFENQNTHLEFKHMRLDGTLNEKSFVKEAYEKKGSYPLAQMSAHTIQQLQHAYDSATASGDEDTKRMVQAVAETFMTRYGAGGDAGNDPEQIARAEQQRRELIASGVTPARAEQVVQTNVAGSAHVAEEVRKLAIKTGVYHPLPPADDVGPMSPTPPTDRQH